MVKYFAVYLLRHGGEHFVEAQLQILCFSHEVTTHLQKNHSNSFPNFTTKEELSKNLLRK
jgi:hypothetical protein